MSLYGYILYLCALYVYVVIFYVIYNQYSYEVAIRYTNFISM